MGAGNVRVFFCFATSCAARRRRVPLTLRIRCTTEDIGNYYYGPSHPMKPHRIRMAHNLILNYGLYEKLQVYVRARCARCGCGLLSPLLTRVFSARGWPRSTR